MGAKTRTGWLSLLVRCRLPRYDGALLWRDLVAGCTVATVAVPQAMAYALLAGVAPVQGLYAAVIVMALGSLFGSSAHLIHGPTSAISLVVFSAVAVVGTGPDDPNRMGLVALLALSAGLIQVALALLGLGRLVRYVSEAVVLGFMVGAGLLEGLTQIPRVLGLPLGGMGEEHLLYRLWLTCRWGGPADVRSLTISLGTLALVVGLRRLSDRFQVRLPEMFLSLVLVSVLSGLFDLAPAGRIGLPRVASGFPTVQLPVPPPDWVRQVRSLGEGALAIALLGLVEALAMARSLAALSGQPLDYDRQCLAVGLANLGGGLFGCMPGSGSLSRSALNYYAGAATRLSGIFSAAAVAAALWLFAPLACFVPQPALAGVLLYMAWCLVAPRRLWERLRSSRADAAVILATAFTAAFVRVEFAVLVGIASSGLCRALEICTRANGLPAAGERRAPSGRGVLARDSSPDVACL
jgi:SulP family sulfate permease